MTSPAFSTPDAETVADSRSGLGSSGKCQRMLGDSLSARGESLAKAFSVDILSSGVTSTKSEMSSGITRTLMSKPSATSGCWKPLM